MGIPEEGQAAAGAVEEGQRTVEGPVLMAFPQSHSDFEGERVVGCRLGNGTTLLVTTIGEATKELEEAGMTAMLVSDADARLVQERHARKQLDVVWMCNLSKLDRFHASMFDEIMDRDIWKGITPLPVQEETCVLHADESEYRQDQEQRKREYKERAATEWKRLEEEIERSRAEARATVAAQEVEAARRDRRAGDVKVIA